MNALLIGLGNIGALKDNERTDVGPPYLTHAHAIIDSPFHLTGMFDIDRGKRISAGQKWSEDVSYTSKSNSNPDIVTIATPPSTHYDVAMDALKLKPKAVVIEKPCGSNLDECVKIVEAYQHANIPLVVNYQRRFSKLLYQIVRMPINFVEITYRDGFNYAGCHAFDLSKLFESYGTDTMVVQDNEIKDAMVIKIQDKVIRPNLDYAFLDLYVNLYDHLTDGTPLLSPAVNAIYPHLMNDEKTFLPHP